MYKQKNHPLKAQQKTINNPYRKQNPYKMKARMYSQKKQHTKKDFQSSNPELHIYRRNYQQNPASYQNNYFKQKNLNAQIDRLNRKLYAVDQKTNNDYKYHKIHFKQYLADQYCPADAYLIAIKDKLSLIDSSKSEFQRMMRLSNISISKFTDKASQSNYTSTKNKQNPFLRKNLIYNNTQRYDLQVFNTGNLNFQNKYSTYHYNYNDFYELDQPKNNYYSKQTYQSVPSYPNSKKQSDNPKYSLKSSPRQGKQDLQCSFGHKNGLNRRSILKCMVDAIIQKQAQDLLKYQQKAPKYIKIAGKQLLKNNIQKLAN